MDWKALLASIAESVDQALLLAQRLLGDREPRPAQSDTGPSAAERWRTENPG